jgi:hypothetical protein
MRQLPFDLAGKRVRLVHGSPRKVNEYLFEDKPARTLTLPTELLASDAAATYDPSVDQARR